MRGSGNQRLAMDPRGSMKCGGRSSWETMSDRCRGHVTGSLLAPPRAHSIEDQGGPHNDGSLILYFNGLVVCSLRSPGSVIAAGYSREDHSIYVVTR